MPPDHVAIQLARSLLRVVYGDGGAYGNIADLVVPPGPGWTARDGSFRHLDAAAPNGVSEVLLRANPSVRGRYKVPVLARNGTVAASPSNLPANAAVVLDVPTAKTGQCGEWRFPATPPARPSRAPRAAGSVLSCR